MSDLISREKKRKDLSESFLVHIRLWAGKGEVQDKNRLVHMVDWIIKLLRRNDFANQVQDSNDGRGIQNLRKRLEGKQEEWSPE